MPVSQITLNAQQAESRSRGDIPQTQHAVSTFQSFFVTTMLQMFPATQGTKTGKSNQKEDTSVGINVSGLHKRRGDCISELKGKEGKNNY